MKSNERNCKIGRVYRQGFLLVNKDPREKCKKNCDPEYFFDQLEKCRICGIVR